VLFFTMAILSFVTPYLEVSLSHAILLWQTICRHLVVLDPKQSRAASPSRRRAQTWCDLFVAPCALNYSLREGACLGALRVGGCNRLRLWCFRVCGLAFAGISFSRNEGQLGQISSRR
jgi:hypothetical protein